MVFGKQGSTQAAYACPGSASARASSRWAAAMVGLFLGLAFLCAAAPAAAGAWQSLDVVRQAVQTHTRAALGQGGEVEVILDGPPPDLHLPACDEPLRTRDLGLAPASGPRTVEVACPGRPSWIIYVPVRVRTRVAALVAARALGAGQVLRAEDLRAVPAEQTALPPSALSKPEEAVGRVLRYAVSAGQPLTAPMLTGAQMVRSGQAVAIVAEGAGVRLVATGVAMENGREGQSILARNSQSGRVVSGVVGAQGEILVSVSR